MAKSKGLACTETDGIVVQNTSSIVWRPKVCRQIEQLESLAFSCEQELQAAFDAVVLSIVESLGIDSNCWPVRGASGQATVGTLKPDVVFSASHVSNTESYELILNIVILGELKMGGTYGDSEYGQLYSAAKYLLDRQTFRSYMYCFLCNGLGFQYIKVSKAPQGVLKYKSLSMEEGWKCLAKLLTTDLKDLGFLPINPATDGLVKILGQGGFSTALKIERIDSARNKSNHVSFPTSTLPCICCGL